ncbi:MAG: hypothetical protein QOE55_2764 [Acidobacteriaceae bacterium]|jgi:hypothetical protein|nr:hypothetical protein [Acidobacteriaceae bacterium]
MSSTKTIPAIASNEYEFQWGREVLFLSNGSQWPTHAQVEPTVRKNRLSLVLRAENMRRALHLVLLLTMATPHSPALPTIMLVFASP